MSPSLEWRMWRQLRGAFAVDRFVFVGIEPEMNSVTIDQFGTMDEALDSCRGLRVFLEPKGQHTMSDIVNIADENMVLILGNTEHGNVQYVRPQDLSVRIKTPKPTDFYGINAAAIALAYRYGQ